MNASLLTLLAFFSALLLTVRAKPIDPPPPHALAQIASPINAHWQQRHSTSDAATDNQLSDESDSSRKQNDEKNASNNDSQLPPCNPPPWRRSRFLEPPSPYLPRCPPS